jgi:hypothetical protein
MLVKSFRNCSKQPGNQAKVRKHKTCEEKSWNNKLACFSAWACHVCFEQGSTLRDLSISGERSERAVKPFRVFQISPFRDHGFGVLCLLPYAILCAVALAEEDIPLLRALRILPTPYCLLPTAVSGAN